jgi:hypothetical protein
MLILLSSKFRKGIVLWCSPKRLPLTLYSFWNMTVHWGVVPCSLLETDWRFTGPWGRSMAQAVSHRPLSAEARVHARLNPYLISGGRNGAATGFSQRSSGLSCHYYSTMALHAHISPGWWTVGPLVAAVQRHILTPPAWATEEITASVIRINSLADCRV